MGAGTQVQQAIEKIEDTKILTLGHAWWLARCTTAISQENMK